MRGAVLWGALALALAGLVWIRLAPSDPARWHRPVEAGADRDMTGAALRVRPGDRDTLVRLDAIARATPRTQRLAGSVEEGMLTYVTRSRVFGFPDYTTVMLEAGTLRLYARLRFGRSDLGVNAARLERWLAQL